MTNQNKVLGFIGIGLMGKPMVRRLLAAGYTVNIYNRSVEKAMELVDDGAKVCQTPGELIGKSQIILLCLADTNAVEAIASADDGIYAKSTKKQLVIDLSSIDPRRTQKIAKKLHQHNGARWIDAPVSGGVSGAEQGTLAIMAGGEDQDIEVAKEILQPLYQQFTHMGAVGSGQMTKIFNQMIVSCNVMVIAEMMALAKSTGINAEKIPEALAGGFADSKPLQIVAPEMASETFEPVKWRVKTLLKDLHMAIELAGNYEQAIPVSGLAAQLMQIHGKNGFLDQDPSTLIKLFDGK